MERTQKNKATEHHLGLLKAKLAKLKSQIIEEGKKAKGGPSGEGFDVAKTGDCRVSMIGFPSVGKSTLMSKMTNVDSEVAAYEFTTLTCIPGEYDHNGTTIQLLDLPGIIEGAKDGKGRGKQVIGVARTCNLILLVLDAMKPMTDKKKIEHELEGFGIRLNKEPPLLTIKKKPKGGIGISRGSFDNPNLPDDLIKSILAEYKWHNCDVSLSQDGLNVDNLIDTIEGNRKYIPCVYVLNKCDALSLEELDLLGRSKNVCPISAFLEWNLDGLKDMIWDRLDLIRIYTKPRGEMPDYSKPVVMKRLNPTLANFCNKIHRNILDNMKFAYVWGSSVKHNPQKCGKDHELQDEDIVQIVKK